MDTVSHLKHTTQTDPNLAASEQDQMCSTPFHPDLVSLERRFKAAKPKSYLEIIEDIFRGSMPEFCTSLSDRDAFYHARLDTIKAKVKGRVRRIDCFTDFLTFLAARTAMVLSYEEAADNVGITKKAALSWASLLEEMDLIYLLPSQHWSGAT